MKPHANSGTAAATEAGPSRRRWQEWVSATTDLAEDWAVLFLRGTQVGREDKRLLIRQELERYARLLVQRELERRGLLMVDAAACLARLPAPHLRGGVPDCGEASGRTPGLLSRLPGCRGQVGDVHPGHALRRQAKPFEVTEEMFQKFSRATGVESAAFSGSPEHVAGLVLYVLIFSLVTCDGDLPDLELQRLLKKLRLCREQMAGHVAALFGRGRFRRDGVRLETQLGADPTTRWLLPAWGERVPSTSPAGGLPQPT